MISLCMICGNEESIILRCLESAKDAFDELCLVHAAGGVDAYRDKTLGVAVEWCQKNGKKWDVANYYNGYVHTKGGGRKVRDDNLTHVDDFGAARNLSFDLANGEWILWLDCDDYLDPINCARIREAVAVCAPETNAIYATYCVEKQGAEIMRERLIRRGFGRWKNPIHETCVVTGHAVSCPQIYVYHSDHTHKHSSSAARNAAILRRTIEDAPRHYFYLHCELKMLKDEQAADIGRIALALLGPDKPEERYIVLLNMSELVPEKREEYLHEATHLQPHRREAFAYLCQSALLDGRTSDAVSYFRLMDALPLPSPLPWTHQGIWYGWARNDLRVQCLRACGQVEQADKEHAQYMQDVEYATTNIRRLNGRAKQSI